MNLDTSKELADLRRKYRDFAEETILPFADISDREERMPVELIEAISDRGYWAPELPEEYGGMEMNWERFGVLTEEIGRVCSNVRNMLGVQGMVSQALLRFGSESQKEKWLPLAGNGKIVTAFALTEDKIGSDAKKIRCEGIAKKDSVVINGRKRWISFGNIADLILLFIQFEGKATAFLVEKDTPGLTVSPIQGLLGYRGSEVAELNFKDCKIPRENQVGMTGMGIGYVAMYGLTHGRYSTACGCIGLSQACLETSLHYAEHREQFGTAIKNHQLIQQMIADMYCSTLAGRQLCLRAGSLYAKGDPNGIMEISLAKYYASTLSMKSAADAVQIHGANGCGPEYPVQRFFRDAKVSEIVEGSSQIQQGIIANHAFKGLRSIKDLPLVRV